MILPVEVKGWVYSKLSLPTNPAHTSTLIIYLAGKKKHLPKSQKQSKLNEITERPLCPSAKVLPWFCNRFSTSSLITAGILDTPSTAKDFFLVTEIKMRGKSDIY